MAITVSIASVGWVPRETQFISRQVTGYAGSRSETNWSWFPYRSKTPV